MEKPKLEFEEITTRVVDYGDLEDFVSEVYNLKNYSFVADQECGNDSSHNFDVDGNINDYEKSNANDIRNGIKSSANYLLLKCLVADGYLEPGNYTIEVCW